MTQRTPTTILVIEDDPSIVRGLSRLLRRDGYHVETASNGRQALALLQRQACDVVLSDLDMPDLDGRAFYARLRQQWPALCARVIFLTGVSSAADHRAFLAQCGQPWLRKPYPIAALRQAIAQVLRRPLGAPPDAPSSGSCLACATPTAPVVRRGREPSSGGALPRPGS